MSLLGIDQNPTRRKTYLYHSVYLVYLFFYPLNWFFDKTPSIFQASYGIAALLAFLVLYFAPYRAANKIDGVDSTTFEIILTALLGFSASWTNAGWMTLNIYASAMCIRLHDTRRAITLLVLLQIALISFAWTVRHVPISGGISVLISLATYTMSWFQSRLARQNQRLKEAQSEIRALATTSERERIARDLHDLLGHSLTVIAIKSELAAKLHNRAPERALCEINDISLIARDSLRDVRAAITNMKSATLTRELEQAKNALQSASISLIIHGAECLAHESNTSVETCSVLAMTLREAITNVIRHSHATQCHITIHGQHNGPPQGITVSDNGTELTCPDTLLEGNGLRGMRARLAAIGGTITLTPNTPGLTLTASFTP
ncbi:MULTISPECIES: sensor histidine kinase [Neokomagataea]|uniref:Two component sensor histidine kinase n=2 Tax=Neokomagataea TaxID=1223423 RepID=A0ABQ0QFM0_9PROT|nr:MULTISPECIES: sensor histidine kinase [Neokomagataea]MBR0558563.1 sensor histidine kinase [Neokomagataea anthophila]GBR43215.1 two component sensor histidine kinase [Neokomagataea tanensis NBRC 106556]